MTSFFGLRNKYITGGGDLLLVNNKTYAVDWDRPLGEGPGGMVLPGINVLNPAEQVIVKVFFNTLEYTNELTALRELGLEGEGYHECAPFLVCYLGHAGVKIGSNVGPLLLRSDILGRLENGKMNLIVYRRPDGTLEDLMRTYDISERNGCMKYGLVKSLIFALTSLFIHGTVHRDISPSNVMYYKYGDQYKFVLGDLTKACTRDGGRIGCGAKRNLTDLGTYRSVGRPWFNPQVFRERNEQNQSIYMDGYADMQWQDIYSVGCILLLFFTGYMCADVTSVEDAGVLYLIVKPQPGDTTVVNLKRYFVNTRCGSEVISANHLMALVAHMTSEDRDMAFAWEDVAEDMVQQAATLYQDWETAARRTHHRRYVRVARPTLARVKPKSRGSRKSYGSFDKSDRPKRTVGAMATPPSVRDWTRYIPRASPLKSSDYEVYARAQAEYEKNNPDIYNQWGTQLIEIGPAKQAGVLQQMREQQQVDDMWRSVYDRVTRPFSRFR